MTGRYVTTGDGRRIGLGSYVRAWRTVMAAPPDAPFDRSLCERYPDNAASILQQFRDGMHDRINRHTPGYGRGRKWSDDYQRAMAYSARLLNTPRLRLHWLPADLRIRFAARLAG